MGNVRRGGVLRRRQQAYHGLSPAQANLLSLVGQQSVVSAAANVFVGGDPDMAVAESIFKKKNPFNFNSEVHSLDGDCCPGIVEPISFYSTLALIMGGTLTLRQIVKNGRKKRSIESYATEPFSWNLGNSRINSNKLCTFKVTYVLCTRFAVLSSLPLLSLSDPHFSAFTKRQLLTHLQLNSSNMAQMSVTRSLR
jgi:hypothetical protein